MSARIEIDKWVVKADTGGEGWVTGEPYTYFNKRDSRDVEGVRDPKYHSRLDRALTSLLDRSLRESDVRSIQDVVYHIRAFKIEIAPIFEVTE